MTPEARLLVRRAVDAAVRARGTAEGPACATCGGELYLDYPTADLPRFTVDCRLCVNRQHAHASRQRKEAAQLQLAA